MPEETGLGEFSSVHQEFKEFDSKMRDPLVVGALLHKLASERENANRLMQEISAKLDRIMALEGKVAQLEARLESREKKMGSAPITASSQVLLPEVDEKILAFVKSHDGRATAADVKTALQYKGRNAASSRLHALFVAGFLEKRQVGKTVYYLSKIEQKPSPVSL